MPRPGYEDAVAAPESVPETPPVPQYAVSMIAQQWSTDTYYVGSSDTKYPITVIAGTKQDGIDEAARALGPPARDRRWRFFDLKMTDARLTKETPNATT